jgi:large subunit ribosomal protein L10
MALSRAKKQELVDSYSAGLATTTHAFLISFKGVTVPQVTALRNRVRAAGGHYQVVKNTLALRAIEGGALAGLKKSFAGPTALAYTSGDPVALAKTLAEFVKETPAIEFKDLLLDGQVLPGTAVQQIAQLPSREALIAKLLFLLQSPIVRLARVLAAVPRDLVVVLDQIRNQKDQQSV